MIDLTQATLKEWAMKQGLDADIESMTQAQKTMLRYQYVMNAARSSMLDFQRTSDTWHNQTVILKESFKALGVVIGQGLINALKPALKGFNTFLSSTIDFAQNVLNALGKIFGWEYEITGGGIADDTLADVAEMATDLGDATGGADSLGDSIGDVGDGIGEATKAADKLKNTILGFDELNVLNDVADALDDIAGSGGSGTGSGAGTGSGTGGTDSGVGGGGGSDPIQVIAKKTKSAFESNIDNLYDLGKYISDSLKKALDDIEWNKIYEKARNFGKGLAQFLNGLIQPETFYSVGRTLANSLNTVVEAALAFINEFDWDNAGKALEYGLRGIFENINWQNIHAAADGLGKGVAEYLNALFTPQLFEEAGYTLAQSLNTVFHFIDNFGAEFNFMKFGGSIAQGINNALDNIDWDTALSAAQRMGYGIAQTINQFLYDTDFREVGHALFNALKVGMTTFFTVTENLDWEQLGTDIGNAINGFLEDFDAEDFAKGVNSVINGIEKAFEGLKGTQAVNNLAIKLGEVLKEIDWSGLAKVSLDLAGLDLALGLAGGIFSGLASNPVKMIIEGGVGLLGNVLSAAIAAKIVGGAMAGAVGGGGGGAVAGAVGAGAVGSGGAVATASAAGTAISGALATGLLVGLPLIGISLALIHANLTDSWDKTQIDQRYNYQKLGANTTNYLDSEVSKTNTANGTIVKTYDSMGREVGVLVNDSTNTNSKKFSDYWDLVVGKSKKGKEDVVSNVYEEWTQHNKTVDEGTREAIAKISEYASDSSTQFDNLREKITSSTEQGWSSASESTNNYTSQIEGTVESSTSNVLGYAESNLGQLPGIFDSYFGQGTDNALWHLGNFESSASSILSNVTSWLYDAINTANEASSISVGPVAHWGGYYAEGGFPDSGTLFMARENASPEMVGRIGTRTAVANNDQIVAGIRAGVMDGMMQVLTATSSGGGSQPIVNEITVTCGEETLYQAVVRGKEKHDRRFQTVATIG